VRNAPPLGTLAWLVTRDANKTVGSGMASIELLRRTLERRGSVIVTIFTAAAATVDRWRAVRVALSVATLVAAALVLANAWSLVRPHLRGARVGWTLATVTLAAALSLAGATPVRVLLALAIWGIVTPSRSAS
jgi:chromate transport protein ChrA